MKWLWDNFKTILLVGGEIITFLWTAFGIVSGLKDIIPENIYQKLFTIAGFLIFAILVYSHIFSLRKQLAPKIDLIFGDFPACRHTFLSAGGPCTLFRVGLVNYGGKTIENVRVSMEQITPQGITHGPIRLLFMNQRQPDEVFRLHPGRKPSLFADIIQDVPINDPPERAFTLQYAISDVSNVLQRGTYCLTLLAEGQDVPSIRKDFIVSWNGAQLAFREGDPAAV